MARPSTLDYNEIKREVESKGVEVIDVNTSSGRLAIYYKCTNCGQESQINYVNYNKGQNSKFLCKRCQALKGPKMQRIQEYFDSMGVSIESVDFFDETGHSLKHWVIHFNCSRCGNLYTILDDYVGKNNKELCCPNCRDNNTVPTQVAIEKLFRDRGSELLSEYKNTHIPVKFRCTKCGGVGQISVAHVKRKDINPNLLCSSCLGRVDILSELTNVLNEKGSKLVGEFKSVDDSVYVSCSECGEPFRFNYGNYKYLGQNPSIICPSCRSKLLESDPLYVGSKGRSKLDDMWLYWALEFFNLYKDAQLPYAAHHIIRYRLDGDRRTSFVNVYPLLKDLHVSRNHYYHYEEGQDINNWSGIEKLPFHNYDGFKFLDLNSKCITEVVFPQVSMDMTFLYKRKKSFSESGILYIPFFINELHTQKQRALAFSMIRARLYKWFPDIYKYTGVTLRKFYARKLNIKKVSHADSVQFFNDNHIQGAVSSSLYLGLYTDAGDLVSCMAFSKPRSGSDYDYEITRFASLINSSVIGGASKLFKYFIDEYNPKSIVSFCDLRFSSMNPNDTVYIKLGFEYAGYSEPNYGYRDPVSGVVKSRRSYQKSMLAKLFDDFDPNLTEFQNMEKHGYVRQVDCGNYKYVWTKK